MGTGIKAKLINDNTIKILSVVAAIFIFFNVMNLIYPLFSDSLKSLEEYIHRTENYVISGFIFLVIPFALIFLLSFINYKLLLKLTNIKPVPVKKEYKPVSTREKVIIRLTVAFTMTIIFPYNSPLMQYLGKCTDNLSEIQKSGFPECMHYVTPYAILLTLLYIYDFTCRKLIKFYDTSKAKQAAKTEEISNIETA